MKPNMPNQAYQTKPAKPNLPNQTYPTKPTKPNLPNQNYSLKQSKPGFVVPLAMFIDKTPIPTIESIFAFTKIKLCFMSKLVKQITTDLQ